MSLMLLPGPAGRWLEWPLLIALLGLPVSAVWRRIRLFQTWRSVAVCAALFAPVLVWLAWDDAKIVTPLSIDQLSPAPASQVDESHQATLAYSAVAGRAAPRTLPSGGLNLTASPVEKPAAWRDEVTKQRAKIEAEWVALAPVREWQAELDRFPAIADGRSAGFDAPIMSLAALRRLGDATCAKAMLLALDGKGDEAFALLRPFFNLQCKLQRHARSESRLLGAQRGISRALATAQLVLSAGPVSTAERAAFAAAAAGYDPAFFAHQLAWLPYVNMADFLITQPRAAFATIANEAGMRNGILVSIVSWLQPFAVLPTNTVNLYARFAAMAEKELLSPAAGTTVDSATVLRELSSASPRNFGGRALLLIAIPNYTRLGESLAKTEAIRRDLLAALAK
jgi:hypothetical protein